jgi:hypothetical protein
MTQTASNTGIRTITDHGIAALSCDMTQIMEAMEFNLGSSGISDLDLTRITVPPGGQPMWMNETLAGPVATPALTGVIVLVREERKYWSTPLAGESTRTPPDCASLDGIHGIGSPGGECISCPLNQFGSDGKGKACGEYRGLFMLRGPNKLPDLVIVPPTSLNNCRKYMSRLMNSGIKYSNCITSLTLAAQKNAEGKPYSEVRFSLEGLLNEQDSEQSMHFNTFVKKLSLARRSPNLIAPPPGGQAA